MNNYCTLSDIKQAMPDAVWSSASDATISSLIIRASRAIDSSCKRDEGTFYVSATSVKYYTGNNTPELIIDDLADEPTLVEVDENLSGTYVTWATTDYYCWPFNALAAKRPYRKIIIDVLRGTKYQWPRYPKSVKITGYHGFTKVLPEDIKQAAIIQVIRWFQRGKVGYQTVGANLDLGQLTYAKADPDLELLLAGAGYIRSSL